MPLTWRRTGTAAPETDFDLRALYEALDERRRSRDLTWAALTAEVNRHRTRLHPIAQSTITSLKKKSVGEGDAIFKRSFGSAERRRALCPALRTPTRRAFSYQRCRGGQILRWDTRALFAALNGPASGTRADMDRGCARCAGSHSHNVDEPGNGASHRIPRVMQLVRWIGEPEVTFTRIASW